MKSAVKRIYKSIKNCLFSIGDTWIGNIFPVVADTEHHKKQLLTCVAAFHPERSTYLKAYQS